MKVIENEFQSTVFNKQMTENVKINVDDYV